MPASPSQSDSPEAEPASEADPAEPHITARGRQDELINWLVLVDDAPPMDAEWEEWAFGQLESWAPRYAVTPRPGDRDGEIGHS